jgi:hypothetical protein
LCGTKTKPRWRRVRSSPSRRSAQRGAAICATMWAFLFHYKREVLTADQVGIYGYGLKHDAPLAVSLPLASARRLHKTIRENFGTLVFCRRYLDRLGLERYLAGVSITTLALRKSVHTDTR